MKKNLLLIAAIFFAATSSFATTFMVSVGGTAFTPSTLTVHPGDVIMWMWTDGTHTTTSTSVPPEAATWNSNINSTTTSFTYTPTVVGTYQYQCNFHVSMGMVGTITVVPPTGIAPVNTSSVFSMSPNPVSGSLHILFNDPATLVSIKLTDMNGKEFISKTIIGTKETDINVQALPNGTYTIRAEQCGRVNKQELVIIH